jgi:hypothetical protein
LGGGGGKEELDIKNYSISGQEINPLLSKNEAGVLTVSSYYYSCLIGWLTLDLFDDIQLHRYATGLCIVDVGLGGRSMWKE